MTAASKIYLKTNFTTVAIQVCGKNLLLPQERKLIGKSKHFETSLGYDIMYLLFTTTPKLLNLLWIRYQLSIVYYIPSCRLKIST